MFVCQSRILFNEQFRSCARAAFRLLQAVFMLSMVHLINLFFRSLFISSIECVHISSSADLYNVITGVCLLSIVCASSRCPLEDSVSSNSSVIVAFKENGDFNVKDNITGAVTTVGIFTFHKNA